MKIKKVQKKDLKALCQLEKKAFRENAFSEEIMEKLIQNHFLFLKLTKGIFIKKKIIGFIIVAKDRKDRANITNFLIAQRFQNQGYGSNLLKETIKRIRKAPNIKSIVLNVHIDNERAIRVYENFGFRIEKKIKEYYEDGKSAFLMRLNL
ncbi:MAG: GNAT family N-acetyltransferase [Promethearchaeia archaeon]